MKTSRLFTVAALAIGVGPRFATAASLRRGGGTGAATIGSAEGAFSSLARNRLHPELVATLLGEVEDAWVQGRVAALRGDVKDTIARAEAMASCRKVAGSIVMGAEGDFDKAKTYMIEVCNKFGGSKGNHTMCQKFGQGIVGAMVGDPSYNRDELNLTQPCGSFYDSAVSSMALELRENEENDVRKQEQAAQQEEATPVKEVEKKEGDDAVQKRAEDKLREADVSLHKEAPKESSNTTNVSTAAANVSESTTSMSPTRARLEETIRKTKAAIEQHEKKAQRALAGTNVTRSRISRNSSSVNSSNTSNTSK